MAKTRKLIVDVIADASRFTNELNKADGYSKRLQGSMQKLGKTMAIGMGVAGAAAITFGKSAIDAAIEAEKAQKAVEATIKSTGGAANVTAKQIDKFASSMMMKTGFDDEAIKKSQSLLLAFRSVRNEAGKGNDIFTRASIAMLDLGAKMGSTDSAAKALGRALTDPIAGLKGLRGAGVSLSDAQKDIIKKLIESGDLLSAQKIVLDEVTKATGGYAASQVTAADQAKLAWGEVQEQVGTALLPVFQKLTKWLIERGIPAMEGFFDWAKQNKPIVLALAAAMGVLTAAVYAVNAVMWALSLNPIVLTIFAIVAAIALLTAGFVIAYQKSEVFRDTVNHLRDGFLSIPPVLKTVWEGIKSIWNLWAGGWEIMVNSFIIGINAIIRGVNFIKPGDDFPTISHLKIPRLAEGGIVSAPTLAMIGEAGPEAIVPLNRQDGIGGNVTINVQASPLSSPADVGAAVVDALKAYERRNGSIRLKVA